MTEQLYFDRARRLLIYRTGRPNYVCEYVPEAKRVNGEFVACPASLKNVQLLRLLKLPVPGIMAASGYDWPIEPGRKPLAHQKQMAEFMVAHPHSFNLSDMGTMKTLATLWACDFIMQQEGGCALIVAPLSILRRVWGKAIFENFLGRRSFQIVHGSATAREQALATPADFYIINFDGLAVGAHSRGSKWQFNLDGLAGAIYNRTNISAVVVDEASAYRDSRTRRHKVARILLGKRKYLWQLTGTPTSNGPTDAYGLAKLSNNAFGESFGSFHNRTMTRVSQFKWVPQAGSYQEARKLLSPAIRYDIKDVWDGPEMTVQQREAELTPSQKRAMAELKRDLQVTIKEGQPITAMNEAAARLKFIQVSLGAVYDADHASHRVDASPRISVLREIIEQAPGKLLCFVPLTSIINMLYEHLKGEINCEIVYGATTTGDRERIFARFQTEHDSLRMLIADPGTMAHGLDLYQARTVVWYGPIDRTELYLQANKRAHRPGQRYPVTVVQIVSNSLEREIFKRLENNESLQGVLLQLIRDDHENRPRACS